MILRQRIAVAYIRVLHTVQQHVHATDSEHGVVKVKAMEGLVVEMGLLPLVAENLWVVVTEVLACCDEEPCCPACWIADHIPWLRRSHCNHQLDNMPWGPKLAILTSRGDLAEHIFVQI